MRKPSRLTRNTFNHLADVIRKSVDCNNAIDPSVLLYNMTNYLSQTNPAFDGPKFRQACKPKI